MLNLFYVLFVSVVGLLLYKRSPLSYLHFTWWVWFISPEVRRLIDYHGGYNASNPTMMAPYIVTSWTLFSLPQAFSKFSRREIESFSLCLVGLIYSFLIGAIVVGPAAALFALIDWIIPIVFCIHLYGHWYSYPLYRKAFLEIFRWATLIMSLYGIFQFLIAPRWDQYWAIRSGLVGSSMDSADPLKIRVFSTLNSAMPFAVVIAAALLLLFSERNRLNMLAAVPGYIAFLLSMVRQAWGGWIIGFFILLILSHSRLRLRLIFGTSIVCLLALLLAMNEPFSTIIDSRVRTLTNLKKDISLNARGSLYTNFSETALVNPIGAGLGRTGISTKLSRDDKTIVKVASLDSGILDIMFSLGWIGALPYLIGLTYLLCKAWRSCLNSDVFAYAAVAIIVATIIQLPFANTIIGVTGMIFWGFLGMSLSAGKFYESQRSLQL